MHLLSLTMHESQCWSSATTTPVARPWNLRSARKTPGRIDTSTVVNVAACYPPTMQSAALPTASGRETSTRNSAPSVVCARRQIHVSAPFYPATSTSTPPGRCVLSTLSRPTLSPFVHRFNPPTTPRSILFRTRPPILSPRHFRWKCCLTNRRLSPFLRFFFSLSSFVFHFIEVYIYGILRRGRGGLATIFVSFSDANSNESF